MKMSRSTNKKEHLIYRTPSSDYFLPEQKNQESLVCEFCFNKENKTCPRVVASRCFGKNVASNKWTKFPGKCMCQSLFLNKVAGCYIFPTSFPVIFYVNFFFFFHKAAFVDWFCKWRESPWRSDWYIPESPLSALIYTRARSWLSLLLR